ncbi:hypothetical protein EYF80_013758 [Liparis tanakae]|uniref:Uncharacterized protein n=1 Tax=Liparis tanakae TaxID=230148 RepID=A0A4Z2IEJ4_9TELE|nr:hypothetical protein EYF80_013758 [Liparis tanakae]
MDHSFHQVTVVKPDRNGSENARLDEKNSPGHQSTSHVIHTISMSTESQRSHGLPIRKQSAAQTFRF